MNYSVFFYNFFNSISIPWLFISIKKDTIKNTTK
jgi:hypothetical protein